MERSVLARLPLFVAGAFLLLFVGAPLCAMLVETVVDEGELTTGAWAALLRDPIDRRQLLYSMLLGITATAVALAFGFGHAWLTWRTDLPGGSWLGPLGIAPLVMPPILVAMGFADFMDAAGFWPCALLLGVCYAPFVAVITARGLRSMDGRIYEAALVCRGRGPAERMLVRSILPEIAAGCLLAFVFVISEHGVPEFLTVKGKTWHTYAEGVFARWTRRATGVSHEDLVGPIVAAVPLVAVTAIAMWLALRFRAHSSLHGGARPLPTRELGKARWPALLLPVVYLGCGVGVPVVVMARWALGSTQVVEPMSLALARTSFRNALNQAGEDLAYTMTIGAAATVIGIAIAWPLARAAARRHRWIEGIAVLPVAVPAVLLGIGFVRVYNSPLAGVVYDVTGDFYDDWSIVACAYAARFLPFGVLTLAHVSRRISPRMEEAAQLAGRGPVARVLGVYAPLSLPAVWSAACLIFILALRELDVAVVLPAGNGTVVRRLSNVVHFGGEDMGGALALLLLVAAVAVPLLTILISGRRLRALS